MAGKTSDRPWAEGFVTGVMPASDIIPKRLASSADGRSEIFPPMNRRNPAPGRMVRCYGSRCGTRDRDSPPEPPLLFVWATEEPEFSQLKIYGLHQTRYERVGGITGKYA